MAKKPGYKPPDVSGARPGGGDGRETRDSRDDARIIEILAEIAEAMTELRGLAVEDAREKYEAKDTERDSSPAQLPRPADDAAVLPPIPRQTDTQSNRQPTTQPGGQQQNPFFGRFGWDRGTAFAAQGVGNARILTDNAIPGLSRLFGIAAQTQYDIRTAMFPFANLAKEFSAAQAARAAKEAERQKAIADGQTPDDDDDESIAKLMTGISFAKAASGLLGAGAASTVAALAVAALATDQVMNAVRSNALGQQAQSVQMASFNPNVLAAQAMFEVGEMQRSMKIGQMIEGSTMALIAANERMQLVATEYDAAKANVGNFFGAIGSGLATGYFEDMKGVSNWLNDKLGDGQVLRETSTWAARNLRPSVVFGLANPLAALGLGVGTLSGDWSIWEAWKKSKGIEDPGEHAPEGTELSFKDFEESMKAMAPVAPPIPDFDWSK
jgi:hypothetical protein